MINSSYVKRRWSKVQIKVLKQALNWIIVELANRENGKGQDHNDDFKRKRAENSLELKCLLRYRQLQDIILVLHSFLKVSETNPIRFHIIPVLYPKDIKKQHQLENRVILYFTKILLGLAALNRNTSQHNKDLIANIMAKKQNFQNRLVGKLLVKEKQKLLQSRSQIDVNETRKIKQLPNIQNQTETNAQTDALQQKETLNDHNQNSDQQNTLAQQQEQIIQFEKDTSTRLNITVGINVIQVQETDQKFEQPNLPILNQIFFQNMLQRAEDIDIQAQIDKWMVKIQKHSDYDAYSQFTSEDNSSTSHQKPNSQKRSR